MSYAEVAGTNIPPLSEQPHPDPALLNTTSSPAPPPANSVDGTSAKVSVVSPPTKTNNGFEDDGLDDSSDSSSSHRRKKANRRFKEVEAEGLYLWDVTKQYLFRPGVAGGLIGLLNIGLLAGAARAFYTQPELRRDRAIISSVIACTIGILGIEGYGAEKYRQTPRGQEEERRAREEGAVIYKHAREHMLRPGVLGGLVGFVNTAIVGTVGYFAYQNWNKPTWDRRVVSSVSIGLATLWGAEGYIAERYRKTH